MVTKVTIARAVYTLDTAAPARRLPAALILTILVMAVGLAAFRMRG
jgi:multisubunit Na+/H+ antiporter MnhC subunit